MVSRIPWSTLKKHNKWYYWRHKYYSRNSTRKAKIGCLNTQLDTSWAIEVCIFWFFKSVFDPWWQGFSRVSWSRFPDYIKAIFYSCHHTPKEKNIEIHAFVKLLRLLMRRRAMYQAAFKSTGVHWRTLHQQQQSSWCVISHWLGFVCGKKLSHLITYPFYNFIYVMV